jgi:3-oxoadipate enol-lactonase
MRRDGAGEPVLLLNGIMMSLGSWQPLVGPLVTAGLQVIRCDLHGQLLAAEPTRTSMDEHLADVVATLDAAGLGSVHVVGTSFGGVLGVRLAAAVQERVRTLTVVAAGDRFEAELVEQVGHWRQLCQRTLDGGERTALFDALEPWVYAPQWAEAHRDEMAERRRQLGRLPDRFFAGMLALAATEGVVDLGSVPEQVRCPTVVLAGELDRLVPVERCAALAAKIPGARFRVLGGCGHGAVMERPEAVSEQIVSLVQEEVDRG